MYKDIAEDIEMRFDTSNYELDRPLPEAGKFWQNFLDQEQKLIIT